MGSNVNGSRELARGTAAYAASLTFAVAFLWSSLHGSSGTTAALRGAIAAAITYVVGRQVLLPLATTLLDAIARDRAERAAADADADEPATGADS